MPTRNERFYDLGSLTTENICGCIDLISSKTKIEIGAEKIKQEENLCPCISVHGTYDERIRLVNGETFLERQILWICFGFCCLLVCFFIQRLEVVIILRSRFTFHSFCRVGVRMHRNLLYTIRNSENGNEDVRARELLYGLTLTK